MGVDYSSRGRNSGTLDARKVTAEAGEFWGHTTYVWNSKESLRIPLSPRPQQADADRPRAVRGGAGSE
jgi:hypothetical protein